MSDEPQDAREQHDPEQGRPDRTGSERAPERSGSQERALERESPDVGDRLERLLAEHREDVAETEPEEPEPYDPFAPAPEADDDAQGPDEDDLPDAPLFALLRTLGAEITPDRIDRVWIFPPRRIETGETAVVVVAAFTETGDERRRVYAAHYTALDDSDQHRLTVDEYGVAPAERIGRLVEEVVERIKDGPTAAPRSARIDGRPQRWDETLHELAEAFIEERHRDRRLRR